jgi:hypothetical protein
MKHVTGRKSFWRMAGNLAVASIVISSVLFVGAAPTSAAGDGAPPQQEGASEFGIARLEFAYLRLLLAADMQDLHLNHAGELAERVQEWIDTLAEQGEDVAELQAGLDAFEDALAKSQVFYQEARDVLDEHAGFDDDGKVTEREQAVETLREAGRSLRDAHRALKDGAIELRRAISDWRRQHRPRPTDSRGAALGYDITSIP